MILHSVPVVVLASISGIVGIFFLSFYLRYPKDHNRGSFALVCFALVLYDIACIGLYNSHSFSDAAEWQRLQFGAIALITITLSFFYHKFTGKLSEKSISVIAVINIGFIIIGYTVENQLTLSPEYTAEKFIDIGSILKIHYIEAQPGIIYEIQIALSLVVYTNCLFGLVSFQRNCVQKKTAVVVAIIVFYFGAVNDSLVGMGILTAPYVLEYAFSALIVAMAAILVSDFFSLHDKVESMNLSLEEAIKEKTKDLKTLTGLLPICAACKKIRDDKGYWNQIEGYIQQHSNAAFSHGLCPECVEYLYPEVNLKSKKSPP